MNGQALVGAQGGIADRRVGIELVNGEVVVASLQRAVCPRPGHIYLPHAYAEVGREPQIQYFADVYPVKVEAVGYRSLYDPENITPRS